MRIIVFALVAALPVLGTASAQHMPVRKTFPTFVETDVDKDGFVTQAEWNASGRSPRRLLQVDSDKDGRVTRGELRQATVAARAAHDNQPKP